MPGPLHGIRIIELAGIGPGPFAGMMLADMGADVIRVDRPGGNPSARLGHDVMNRNRRTVGVNLKSAEGAEVVRRMAAHADGLFEGFRPGVAERLGVGPDVMLERNPRLVYGRMTGWGQDGPLANAAGHDINYIALTGALDAIGRSDSGPVPPLNLVGDFGGGGLMLAFGMVCALFEAQRSGEGQVVDAAMVDGAAALMAMFHGMRAQGIFPEHRGTSMLDTGAHFYDVYETSDNKWISIGAIEPQFYTLLREKMGLTDPVFDVQLDMGSWPELTRQIAAVVATKTRDEWDEILLGTDVCYAPVLHLSEVADHPHNVARDGYLEVNGHTQQRPAPRFSRTTPGDPVPVAEIGVHTREVLTDLDFTDTEINDLLSTGAIAEA